MRRAVCLGVFLGVAIALGAVSCTKEGASPEERGEKLLRGLQQLESADADTAYFEAILGGSICGVAELSLTPYSEAGRKLYEYRYLLTLRLTKASVFLRSMKAIIDPAFSPVEITDEKMTLGPQGPMDRAQTTVTVRADKVSIREFQKGEETSREVATPERPFVCCASHILQIAKPQAGSSFSLPLFRASDGAVTRNSFQSTIGSEGLTHIEVVDEDGKPAGSYRLSAEGRLESFQETGAAWVMERTTKEKVTAFQQAWSSALNSAAPSDSGATPGAGP